MSFNNTHMREVNMINFGVRHDTVKLSTNKDIVRPDKQTYIHLMDQLKGIHTWEQLKTRCVTPDLYGNTKHTDFWILAGYFHEELHILRSSNEVGYSVPRKKNGREVSTGGLEFRLQRINVKHLFSIIKALLDKGLIQMETIQNAFETQKYISRGEAAKRRGKFYKYYANWFINDGLIWFAQEGHADPVDALSHYLGISEEAIYHWSDMEVTEVRIIHE